MLDKYQDRACIDSELTFARRNDMNSKYHAGKKYSLLVVNNPSLTLHLCLCHHGFEYHIAKRIYDTVLLLARGIYVGH